MKNSKLMKVILMIGQKEWKLLLRFANAQLIHEDQRIPKLLTWIMKNCKDNEETPDKLNAYRSVFGNRKYNDTDMRVLMTKSVQTVFSFIAFRETEAHAVNSQQAINLFLLRCHEHKLLETQLDKLFKDLEMARVKDQHYYWSRLQAEETRYTLTSRLNKNYNFDRLFKELDNFYLFLKLKFFALHLNSKFVFKQSIDPEFVSGLKKYLFSSDLPLNNASLAYSSAVLMQTDENHSEHLKAVEKILQQGPEDISAEDLRILAKLAENYCIREVNKGHHEYYEVIHQLLANRLKRETEISAAELKNFITVCLRTGKHGEVMRFLKENREKISPIEIREDAFNFNIARYYFHQKDFTRVLKLLQQVSYFDVFYKIDSKKLLIQTFYEIREMDSLDSAMNAFRVFIHREKSVSEVHRRNNKNFINLLYQLLPLQRTDKKKLGKLERAVLDKEALAEREWLLQKIAELK